MMLDTNRGLHYVRSKEPLSPIEVIIEEPPKRTVEFRGRTLTVSSALDSHEEFVNLLHSVYFGLPSLLAIPFADPPFIEVVDGEIGGIPFRWELRDFPFVIETTTQEDREREVATAWFRMAVIARPGRRRLLAALHYLHVGCRLAREGESPGEFLSEVLLNFAKVLEVLFPGSESMNAARRGLADLGYSTDEMEAWFIPALALRNHVDVGHVHLALFTRAQLEILHSYADVAERHLRGLLDRVLDRVEAGDWVVPEYHAEEPRKAAARIVDRLKAARDSVAAKEEAQATPEEGPDYRGG